jgi:hypothetical protein
MTAEAAQHPFTPRTILVMVLVGVFTMSAFLVLASYAPELRSGRDGRGHALSRSAIGFAGVVQLAQQTGLDVMVSRRGVQDGSRYSELTVLTPEPGAPVETVQAEFEQARSDGATLVVLPKWLARPDVRHPGWVAREGLLAPKHAGLALPEALRPTVTQRKGGEAVRVTATGGLKVRALGLDIGRIDNLQTLSGEGFTPLLQDDEGATLLASAPGRPDLLILSDPDLLNTQGLRDMARARLAISLLEALAEEDGRVIFDVSVNGFSGGRNLLKLALEPPFLAATLCALLAAALMGWHAAARFGAPRPSPRALALGKTALADNSAALFRMADREPRMAVPYAELVLQAASRAAGVPRNLDRAEADALLDRLSRRAGAPPASALMAEAQAVRDTAGLMAVAQRLFDFRRRMTRERG